MSFGRSPSYVPPAEIPVGLTPAEKAAEEAAQAAEKTRLKAKKGFASTLLSSGAEASIEKKTLLGQ